MHHGVISMNTNSPHFLNERMQDFDVIAKQSLIQFRIASSCYLQNFKVRQLPKPKLWAMFKSYSNWEITFVDSLPCDLIVQYQEMIYI